MSKAQTDIRTTSYDVRQARPLGYQGTIDDVIAQIQKEDDYVFLPTTRFLLLKYLGVYEISSAGPSVELDEGVYYGVPESAKDYEEGR